MGRERVTVRTRAWWFAATVVAVLAAVGCGSASTTSTAGGSDGTDALRQHGTALDSTTSSAVIPDSTAASDDPRPPSTEVAEPDPAPDTSDPRLIGTWARVTPEPKFCAIEQSIDAPVGDADLANPCSWSWAFTGTARLDDSGSAVFDMRDGRCEGRWTTTTDSITVDALTCDPAVTSTGRPKVADLVVSPDGRPGCFQVEPRDDPMDEPVLFCPGTSPTTTR